ncbi:hypothetical protein [Variovorax sp. V116]|uniref:hypothetical protein n=1 Tax=Variovorax sp. V116 TaxID=3065953 RepID=UPI0034E858AD
MKARIVAWVIVLGLAYAGYSFASKWDNPWGKVAMPVTAVMPSMPQCGEDCKK